MHNNIRHTLLPLLTAIACVAASCTSDEPGSEGLTDESREEIKFEVAPDSRTIITDNSNITENPYMLFGDISLNNKLDQIFYWQQVTYDGKKWNYGVTQYWFMGHEHSFVAIHPFIPKGDPQVSILTYENNKLSFTYTLPEKLEEAKDLLFATHRREYTLDTVGPVKFKFTHLLPRINISMALIEKELMYDHVEEGTKENPYNKNEYIAVHSIEFVHIKTKASFTFAPKPLNGTKSTYDYEMSYLLRDDQKVDTITVTLNEPCKVPNSYKEGVTEGLATDSIPVKYVTALNGNEIIVMLPQTFVDNPTAQMVVNYSINDDADLKRRIVIPLKDKVWEEGVFYTYKFLIDNAYYGHVKDGKVTIDVDDSRITGDNEKGDDSWYFDNEDPDHNIWFGYSGDGTKHNGKQE